jgi:hypothetical protein
LSLGYDVPYPLKKQPMGHYQARLISSGALTEMRESFKRSFGGERGSERGASAGRDLGSGRGRDKGLDLE